MEAGCDGEKRVRSEAVRKPNPGGTTRYRLRKSLGGCGDAADDHESARGGRWDRVMEVEEWRQGDGDATVL